MIACGLESTHTCDTYPQTQDSSTPTCDIPKRPPCLNVCDYFLWSAVNRRMQEQEKKFSKTKRETRAAFLRRLRRTAFPLPSEVLIAAMGEMKRRCAALPSAADGNIEEGGKVPRAA